VSETGMIDVPGGRVWYQRSGSGDAMPLLALHGGPGAAHYYLDPFVERMSAHRPVIVYDQLGCGESEKPDDVSLWTVDRFVEELDVVREALGLEQCHLFGQSWGGWLSIEYMARGREGIQGLILASTSASTNEFTTNAAKLIDELPEPHATALKELGALGKYDDPAYLAAVDVFYQRHLCRLAVWPEAMLKTANELDGNQVYLTMNGPTEFDVIGPLKTWDRSADLGRIGSPTLVTCGRYDEITPACSETITRGVPDARMVVFEESAHCAHLEEPDRYAAVAEEFLAGVDASRATG
jgi:proline-specific peptidase